MFRPCLFDAMRCCLYLRRRRYAMRAGFTSYICARLPLMFDTPALLFTRAASFSLFRLTLVAADDAAKIFR